MTHNCKICDRLAHPSVTDFSSNCRKVYLIDFDFGYSEAIVYLLFELLDRTVLKVFPHSLIISIYIINLCLLRRIRDCLIIKLFELS